jgi:hypothetical protein
MGVALADRAFTAWFLGGVSWFCAVSVYGFLMPDSTGLKSPDNTLSQ